MAFFNANKHLQKTLKKSFTLTGVGVHTGHQTAITLNPAPSHHGIVFRVQQNGQTTLLPAHFSRVSALNNATALGHENGASLCTIEHVMAALVALGVDNCLVDVIGEEIPVFDGSSAAIVNGIDNVGLQTQQAPRRYLRILKNVSVENGLSTASLKPASQDFKIDVTIDFKAPIGKMRYKNILKSRQFRHEIARARTFGFLDEHHMLTSKGLALGSSLDNTVVFDGDRVLNDGGLRYADEMVRHKWLDAVGDLALAGANIIGEYTSYRGGHRLNIMMLQALFSDPTNYEYVTFAAPKQAIRPAYSNNVQPAYI
jgi:UDP-3-O-[3-hydroxymyristoyl] N-acetylglucosamine deacetylase